MQFRLNDQQISPKTVRDSVHALRHGGAIDPAIAAGHVSLIAVDEARATVHRDAAPHPIAENRAMRDTAYLVRHV